MISIFSRINHKIARGIGVTIGIKILYSNRLCCMKNILFVDKLSFFFRSTGKYYASHGHPGLLMFSFYCSKALFEYGFIREYCRSALLIW